MSVRVLILLLAAGALVLVAGPGLRRKLAQALGLAPRPPRLRDGPDDSNAFRAGRIIGRLAARRDR